MVSVKVENISKQYRLGVLGSKTLVQDVNRWFASFRGKSDPYQKVDYPNSGAHKNYGEFIWALKNVSFEVKTGEIFGLIGNNGAGKSTLLKILSRVTRPTKGIAKTRGRVVSLLDVGTGFHPELTGRENAYLNGAILGMSKEEINQKIDAILEFANVGEYIDTPVKRYSSGMYVRLAFAIAAHLEPEILIVDEVLSIGDAEFQEKAFAKIKETNIVGGKTIIFVSHNLHAVQKLCNRVALLEAGALVGIDVLHKMISQYLSKIYGNAIDPKKLYPPEHSPLEVNRIQVDGSEHLHLSLPADKFDFSLSIEFSIHKRLSFLFTLQLYDESGTLLGSYFPQYDIPGNEYTDAEAGKFMMTHKIQFPKMNKGTYLLSFEFTKNSKEAYCCFEKAINLHLEGTSTIRASVPSQSSDGYFIIEGNTKLVKLNE